MSVKDEEKSRQRKLDTIIKRLEKSGLWANLLVKFKNMKLYTEEERNRLYALDWEDEEKCKQEMKAKYPFMIYERDGRELIDHDYIWELSRLKTKSMYFGKLDNKIVKEDIKKHLEQKKDFSYRERVNYDVSFSYVAESGKAWYSEEYKNCGNGHYYLALDESMAIFCEDD